MTSLASCLRCGRPERGAKRAHEVKGAEGPLLLGFDHLELERNDRMPLEMNEYCFVVLDPLEEFSGEHLPSLSPGCFPRIGSTIRFGRRRIAGCTERLKTAMGATVQTRPFRHVIAALEEMLLVITREEGFGVSNQSCGSRVRRADCPATEPHRASPPIFERGLAVTVLDKGDIHHLPPYVELSQQSAPLRSWCFAGVPLELRRAKPAEPSRSRVLGENPPYFRPIHDRRCLIGKVS